MGMGGRLSNVGEAHLFFLYSLMGIFFFFFLQGPRPPQATMWLRPCTAVWICLEQLPIEYYHPEFLKHVGKKLGKLLKVDAITSAAI